MPKILKSREFLRKVAQMTEAQQRDVQGGINHVAADPTNKDFRRPYLTPFLQEHLPQDKQYTLYFELRDNNETIYFVWINDSSCLHTTRANTEDPDVKEFVKRRNAWDLELFEHSVHVGEFKIKPRTDKPTYFELAKLGVRVRCNVYKAEDGYRSAAVAILEDEHDQTYDVLDDFLDRLADHFKSTLREPFEFQLHSSAHDTLIAKMKAAANTAKWKITDEDGVTIFAVQ